MNSDKTVKAYNSIQWVVESIRWRVVTLLKKEKERDFLVTHHMPEDWERMGESFQQLFEEINPP